MSDGSTYHRGTFQSRLDVKTSVFSWTGFVGSYCKHLELKQNALQSPQRVWPPVLWIKSPDLAS